VPWLWSSGVAVVVGEVVAVHVVHVAVAVVVEAVARDLAGVGPDVGREVGMGVVDAGVDDRDDHRRIAGREVPGLRRVDARVGCPPLPGVVQAPELPERRVGRDERDGNDRVELGRLHGGVTGESTSDALGVLTRSSVRRSHLSMGERRRERGAPNLLVPRAPCACAMASPARGRRP
jgi:hypothetical protein